MPSYDRYAELAPLRRDSSTAVSRPLELCYAKTTQQVHGMTVAEYDIHASDDYTDAVAEYACCRRIEMF